MFAQLLSLFLFAAALVGAADDGWHLDFTYVLTNENLDPIVSPNAQGSHMHKVMGGSRFGASYNYADYNAAKCSSLRVQADKSNYWMPSLYWMDNGQFIPIQANMRFYYFLPRNSPSQIVSPFPKGLQMVVGNGNAKSATNYADFSCHLHPTLVGDATSDNFNFNVTCPYGMKTEVYFPGCWDGLNLHTTDGSHMSYPIGANSDRRDGSCPLSHPVRIPTIMLEYTWHPELVAPGAALAGNLIWSTGDTTGYGIHADFVNGWDIPTLAAALNSTACGIGSGNAIPMEQCPTLFATFNDAAAKACVPEKGVLTETFGNNDLVPIPRLPGCNAVWGSTGDRPVCNPPIPSLDVSAFVGVQGPTVTDTPMNFVLPTTPGWSNVACIQESTALLNAINYIDPKMTQDSCQQSCYKGGYPFAAIGERGLGNFHCVCAMSLDITKAPTVPGSCTDKCPGNTTQGCGANYIYNVFYAPAGTTMSLDLATYGSGATYVGCLNTQSPQTSTYSFTSATMTRQICNQACTTHNATWSALTQGRTCYCGTDFTSPNTTSFVPDIYCTIACPGNTSQICGDTYRSSIFNLTKASFAVSTGVHATGWQGCFAEGSGHLALQNASWTSSFMTQSSCVGGCAELGYAFAGTRSGNQCFCGAKFNGGQSLPTSQCATPCAGSSSLFCGGSGILDLYSTAGYPTLAQVGAGMPAPYMGCFVDTGTTVALTNYTYTSGTMTPATCVQACASFKYPYAGVENGNECKCGSLPPSTMQVTTPLYCTKPCNGNATAACGGSGYLQGFNVTSLLASSLLAPPGSTNGSMGCYSSSPVGLTATSFSTTGLTIQMCRTGCAELGYSLSGVDGGTTCRCGNSWVGGQALPASSCSTTCAGDKTQICGGPGATSLWNNAAAAPIPTKPPGWLGCYNALSTARTINGFTYTSSTMTSGVCRAACSLQNYTIAGVEIGSQCFCSNAITSGALRVPQVLCNAACSGLADETCGGSYKLDVYNATVTSTTATTDNSTTTSPSTTSTGLASHCFTDDSALTGTTFTSDFMSMTICETYCFSKSYAYAGVRNGNQCKCGNTAPILVTQFALCNNPCTADSTQNCGTSSNILVANVAGATGLSSTGLVLNTNSSGFVGCFAEGSISKFMPLAAFSSSTMTNNLCIQNCNSLGYKYAGTEFGSQCFCSQALNNTGGGYQVQTSDCSMACAGGGGVCGNSGKLQVYEIAKVSNNAITNVEGHKGCFAWGTYSTSPFSYSANIMTPNLCRETCRTQGFANAGLYNGIYCYCSATANYGVQVVPASCNRPCAGDATQTCGGLSGGSWDIYDTTGPGAFADKTGMASNYVGCFVDNPSPNRVMSGYTFSNSAMTPDLCTRVCTGQGYNVSGTEGGSVCYCSSKLPVSGLYPDSACSTNCNGYAGQKCGGSYRISVYSAVFAQLNTSPTNPNATISVKITSSTLPASSSSASSVVVTNLAVTAATSSSATQPTTQAAAVGGLTVASSSIAASVAGSSSSVSSSTSSMSAPSAGSPVVSSSAVGGVSSSSQGVSHSVGSSSASASLGQVASSSVSAASTSLVNNIAVTSTQSSYQSSMTMTMSMSMTNSASASAISSSISTSAPAVSSVTVISSSAATPSSWSSYSAPASAVSSSAIWSSASVSSPPSSATMPSFSVYAYSSSTSSAAKSTSTASVITDSAYQGCFTQPANWPIMVGSNMTCSTLTPGMCKIWCHANNYDFAGVSGGNFCGCANTNDVQYLTLVANSQCTSPCSGQAGSMCGGSNGVVSLYQATSQLVGRHLQEWKEDADKKVVLGDGGDSNGEVVIGSGSGSKWFTKGKQGARRSRFVQSA